MKKILSTFAIYLFATTANAEKQPEITTSQAAAKDSLVEKRSDLMKAAHESVEKTKPKDSKTLIFFKDGEKFIDHSGAEIPNTDSTVDTKGTKTSAVLNEIWDKASESGSVVTYKKKNESEPTKDDDKKATSYIVNGKEGKLYAIAIIEPSSQVTATTDTPSLTPTPTDIKQPSETTPTQDAKKTETPIAEASKPETTSPQNTNVKDDASNTQAPTTESQAKTTTTTSTSPSV